MLKTIASILAKRRTLQVELELDHIELSPDQFILGLNVKWTNNTPDPVEIHEVMVHLFHHGKTAQPISLTYNGRFVRIPYQKTVTKIAGANSFYVQPGASQVESLRFMTREILDLREGTHAIELHTTVPEGTYVHNFDVKVVPQLKNRLSQAESETTPLPANTSAAYTRALRLGLNSRATA